MLSEMRRGGATNAKHPRGPDGHGGRGGLLSLSAWGFGPIVRQLWRHVTTPTGSCVVLVGVLACLPSIVTLFALVARHLQFLSPRSCPRCCSRDYYDNLAGRTFEPRLCLPTVDAVYTWVNGSDPELQAAIRAYLRDDNADAAGGDENPAAALAGSNATAAADAGAVLRVARDDDNNRFRDNYELKYSLRSLRRHAPWIRRVYIVTNGQVPHWLDAAHPRLRIVEHADIFPNASHLPTFSSPAIESHLHRIPGLADHFLYFNDDVVLGNDVWPDDFYTASKGHKIYLSWSVPSCHESCPDSWVGDGYCDQACNIAECEFDGGDCGNSTQKSSGGGDGSYNAADQDRFDDWRATLDQAQQTSADVQYCALGCPDSWLGDRVCDQACKTSACGYDAGDCFVFNAGDVHTVRLARGRAAPAWPTAVEDEYASLGLGPGSSDVTADRFWDAETVVLPIGAHALVVNVSDVLRSVDAAWHDRQGLVRRAAVTQRAGALTLVLRAPKDADERESGDVDVVGAKPGDEPAAAAAVVRHRSVLVSLRGPSREAADEVWAIRFNVTMRDEVGDAAGHRRLLDVEAAPAMSFAAAGPSAGDDGDDLCGVLGVPGAGDSAGSVVLRSAFTAGDWALARRIGRVKCQQQRRLLEAAEEVVWQRLWDERLRGLTRRQRPQDATVWPWELLTADAAAAEQLSLLSSSSPAIRRRLLGNVDTFGGSLRYVNALYNQFFGREQRKVPAHMPHYMDKRILEELQAQWPERFDQTSSHRFRDVHDMQFSFSYFYYLRHKKHDFSLSAFFSEELDRDRDGVLDEDEVEHLATFVSTDGGSFVSDRLLSDLLSDLRNISIALQYQTGLGPFFRIYEVVTGKSHHPITETCLARHDYVMERLKKRAPWRYVYKWEEVDLDEVEFYMMGDDPAKVRARLDGMRKKRPKFMCINDDMNKTHAPDPRVVTTLHDFFESFFPLPGEFERTAPNPSLRWSELRLLTPPRHEAAGSGDDTPLSVVVGRVLVVAAAAIALVLVLDHFSLLPLRAQLCVRRSSWWWWRCCCRRDAAAYPSASSVAPAGGKSISRSGVLGGIVISPARRDAMGKDTDV